MNFNYKSHNRPKILGVSDIQPEFLGCPPASFVVHGFPLLPTQHGYTTVQKYINNTRVPSTPKNTVLCRMVTECWKANQRAAEERRSHVADATEHDSRSDADVTDFRWKYLVRKYVDTTEGDTNESFTEHCERHGSHVIFCTYVQTGVCGCWKFASADYSHPQCRGGGSLSDPKYSSQAHPKHPFWVNVYVYG